MCALRSSYFIKMNDKQIEEVGYRREQLDRGAKRLAQGTINRWVDYVSSVGGRDSTDDWHSSSSGVYGDSSEDDDEESSEEATGEGDSMLSDDSEGNSRAEQRVLYEVWGNSLRMWNANGSGQEKRLRTDSGDDQAAEYASGNLGSSSESDDCSSEGSDGSYGSLADFISEPSDVQLE